MFVIARMRPPSSCGDRSPGTLRLRAQLVSKTWTISAVDELEADYGADRSRGAHCMKKATGGSLPFRPANPPVNQPKDDYISKPIPLGSKDPS